jgi:hypothetical protein
MLVALLGGQAVFAQSLGEIAERERKKREGTKKPAAPASQSFSDQDLPGSWTTWRTFDRPADGFSVQFPAAPLRSEDALETPDGSAPRREYRVSKDKREYVVMVADLPAALVKRGPEVVFDLAEAQARRDFAGSPYTRRSSSWQGHAARDFQLRSNWVGGDDEIYLSFDGRMVLSGTRLYVQVQLLHNGPDTVDMPPDFMASLAITPAAASAVRK